MRFVTHWLLLVLVGIITLAAVATMAQLYSGGVSDDDPAFREDALQRSSVLDAQILEVTPVPDEDPAGLPPGAVSVEVTARLDDTGEVITFPMIDDTGDTFHAGQRVTVTANETDGEDTLYVISDFQRERPLALLAGLFVVAVIAFGRFQGVRALIGLALTGLLIVLYLIPTILNGQDPVQVALSTSMVIMVITLYLSHGASRKTTAAVVGTALALLLTGALAALFVEGANLTGFTSEEARLANVEAGGLSLRGLLLAGIILGGLGVLDDVTMSQASTVFELRRANPRAGFRNLTRGALTVGRDHVAATVNTLFLAYAGAALPLLILFAVGIDPVVSVLTSEIVAVEVVRTLVGSLGLIAAVPITTALAAVLACSEPKKVAAEARHRQGHHHAHGPATVAAPAASAREFGPQPMPVMPPGYPAEPAPRAPAAMERFAHGDQTDRIDQLPPPEQPPMPGQGRLMIPGYPAAPFVPPAPPPSTYPREQRPPQPSEGRRPEREQGDRRRPGRGREPAPLPEPTSPQEADDLDWIRQLRDAYNPADPRRDDDGWRHEDQGRRSPPSSPPHHRR
ncbi:MAG: hypothetical protein GEU81_08520 [Nitriliruptorales bacterium]|nr:hypothetical protein [Nitriliruptorales bacterium]